MYSNGLYFSFEENIMFQDMIMASKNCSEVSELHAIYTFRVPLLDSIHERNTKSVRGRIINNNRALGVHFQGYGSYIKVPLFNILTSSVYLSISLLD